MNIKHELDFLQPSIRELRQRILKNFTTCNEKNLDYQVNVACKKYKRLIKSGSLTVMAGFYDFKGEYGKGMGDIVIVNVNRHKDAEIRNLPIFEYLSAARKICI